MKTLRPAMLVVGAMLFLSACGPGTCIDPSTLTYRVQRGETPLAKGESAQVDLIVTNRSDHYMLVEGVSGTHLAAGGPDSLIGAEQGSLEPDGQGGYRFLLEAQQETLPVFASGLIPPGQKLPIRMEIVPQDPAGSFTLSYWGLTADEAATHLLFPARVKGQLDRTGFVPWDSKALDKVARETDAEGTRSPVSVQVILRPELQKRRPRCTVDMPYRLKLEQ